MDSWIQLARWEDAVDVAAVALMLWLAIRYLRRTPARAATLGLALLGAIYAAATALDLRLTASLFQAFFAAVVLVLVVVFQQDIRRFLEQLGSWRPGRNETPDRADTLSVLLRAVAALAEARTGALFVLPRREPIDRHVDGGVVLHGAVSEPLLYSLFDASSPGHDGAVIVRDGVVERFAVHLPLSSNRDLLGTRGTRHAAALGLAERCDAVCIVVSEERGTISVARNGDLRTVGVNDLAAVLLEGEPGEEPDVPVWRRSAWVEGAAAIVAAVVVWIVFVPGSDVEELVLPATVEVTNLPNDLVLESVDPPEVDVTLSGPRRNLLLADPATIAVHVDGYLARLGRRTFSLTPDDVSRPNALSVVDISPERVRVSLRAIGADGSSE